MKRINACRVFIVSVVILCWPGLDSAVFAGSVFIQSDTEFGQGVAFERNSNCYVATPAHVVPRGSKVTVLFADRQRFEAKEYYRSSCDENAVIAIVILDLNRSKCPTKTKLFKESQSVTIVKSNRDGFLDILKSGKSSAVDVTASSVDMRSSYFRIVKKASSRKIIKGDSGSALKIGGQIVGMLVKEDPKYPKYKQVLRWDYVSGIIKNVISEEDTNNRIDLSFAANDGDLSLFEKPFRRLEGSLNSLLKVIKNRNDFESSVDGHSNQSEPAIILSKTYYDGLPDIHQRNSLYYGYSSFDERLGRVQQEILFDHRTHFWEIITNHPESGHDFKFRRTLNQRYDDLEKEVMSLITLHATRYYNDKADTPEAEIAAARQAITKRVNDMAASLKSAGKWSR